MNRKSFLLLLLPTLALAMLTAAVALAATPPLQEEGQEIALFDGRQLAAYFV